MPSVVVPSVVVPSVVVPSVVVPSVVVPSVVVPSVVFPSLLLLVVPPPQAITPVPNTNVAATISTVESLRIASATSG